MTKAQTGAAKETLSRHRAYHLPMRPTMLVFVLLAIAGCAGRSDGGTPSVPGPGLAAATPAVAAPAFAPARVVPLGGAEPWPECPIGAALAEVGPGCRPNQPIAVSASGSPEAARAAIDGDVCTIWNSGDFAPQSLEVDFGQPVVVSSLVVSIEATPDGPSMHVLETADEQGQWTRRVPLAGVLTTRALYHLVLPEPIRARRFRVRSTDSASWIAWRELVFMDCR